MPAIKIYACVLSGMMKQTLIDDDDDDDHD